MTLSTEIVFKRYFTTVSFSVLVCLGLIVIPVVYADDSAHDVAVNTTLNALENSEVVKPSATEEVNNSPIAADTNNSSTDVKLLQDTVAAQQQSNAALQQQVKILQARIDQLESPSEPTPSSPVTNTQVPLQAGQAAANPEFSPAPRGIIHEVLNDPVKVQVSAYASNATSEKGLFSTDFIVPLYYPQDKNTLVFYNPKYTYTDPAANEVNQGFGIRHIFNDSFILGANAFFDRRESNTGNWFSQAGIGFEYLSHPLDMRLNWYKPTTGAKDIGTPTYGFGPTSLIEYSSKEEAMQGEDFEFGVPVLDQYTKTRLYVGGYFYQAQLGPGMNGFRARTETSLTHWLSIDTVFNSDIDNRVEFYGGLRVAVPFELADLFSRKNWTEPSPSASSGNSYLEDRIFDRVVRDIDIQTKVFTTQSIGQGLIYVDDAYSGPQYGTLANPYETLGGGITATTGNNRWIYLEGTTAPYVGNFTLPNGKTLWGSGFNGGFDGLHVSGVYPVIDGASSGNVLTLGSGNTVMGTQVQHSGTSGNDAGIYASNESNDVIKDNNIVNNNNGIYIEADNANVSGFNILNNVVELNSNDGLSINNTSSTGGSFTVSGFTISGNTFSYNVNMGLQLQNTTTGASSLTATNFTITGNAFNNNIGNTDGDGLTIVNSNSGTGTLNASDYDISGNIFNYNSGPSGVGLFLYNDNTSGILNASNYTFDGDTFNYNSSSVTYGVGLFLENNNSSTTGTFTASNYTFRGDIFNHNSGTYGLGLGIENLNSGTTLTASDYTFIGDAFDYNIGSIGAGLVIYNTTSSSGTVTSSDYTFDGDTFNDNSGGQGIGLALYNHNTSTGSVMVTDYNFGGDTFNNNIGGNLGVGLYLENRTTTSGVITATDFNFTGDSFNSNSGNDGAGLYLYNDNTSTSGTITTSTLTTGYTFIGDTFDYNVGPDGVGLYLYNDNTSTSGTITASYNTFTGDTFNNNHGNDGLGLLLNNTNSSSGGTLTASNDTITGNIFDNNTGGAYGAGLTINNNNSSSGTLTANNYIISGNTIDNNSGPYGVGLGVVNNSSGIAGTLNATNYTIAGNIISYNADPMDGALSLLDQYTAGALTTTNYTITGNTITYNGNNGIYIDVGSYVPDMTFSHNTITGNGGDGVLIPVTTTVAGGINFGNGTPGSGDNSIYGNDQLSNGSYDVDNLDSSLTLPAEDNWWGQASGPSGTQIHGLVTSTPYLTSNPN